ncbi:hypothetical protein ACQP2T_42885 [Nonomuraea sp. CA-143628]|uniref:hypothetical protein n=1 Tax=Nonomuraea sp. CA-143628 TaxID=3239997 RepID=UPI003D911E7E
MDLGIISLVVSIAIGVPQIYLAWQQVRLSRNQAAPWRTRGAENAPRPTSPAAATRTEPTASPGSAQPPHDAPTEPPIAEPRQRHEQEARQRHEQDAHRRLDPQPHPRPDPQAESRPAAPPPDAPSEDAARVFVPDLRAYIAPASLVIGGFLGLSALGGIFAYDDLAKDYTTPMGRAQLTVSLWFTVVALLIASFSTGFTAYAWHREKAVNDDNEERFNLYVLMAVLGPTLAVWLVIARRAVMF